MQPAALKTPRKRCQTWPGQVDKNFQGRTKIFNIIAEKFCPRIKILGGTIFFLTEPYKAPKSEVRNLLESHVSVRPMHFCGLGPSLAYREAYRHVL